MRRLLKILAWTFGVLMILLVVAAVTLISVFDPNDYRGEISTLVKHQTGRDLTIAGNLKLSIFPWLGVDVGEAQLSNRPGFGPDPFARIERANVQVKLLPLLRRQVELDEVKVIGLRLHLARDREGRTNWDDLIRAAEEPSAAKEPAPEERPGLAAFRVGGIAIRDAQVKWEDQSKGQEAKISNLTLRTGELDLRSPIELSLETDFALNAPEASGHLNLRGKLNHDEEARRYGAEGLSLDLDLHGAAVPGGTLKASLTGDAAADLKAQTADLKRLRLEAYGARANLSGAATKILGDPEARGEFELQVIEPDTLAAALSRWVPLTLESKALSGGRVASSFEVSFERDTASMPKLRANLLGIDLEARIEARKLRGNPAFTGHMALHEFSPRDLMTHLGIALPPMADPDTLAKAALTARFDAGTDHLALQDLVVRLDKSTLKGRLAAQRFTPLRLRYDLTLDQIDADRYLPPPSQAPEQPAPATEAATAPLQLPVEQLRSLDIDGTLRVGQLKAANMRSTDILATLRAQGGQFRLNPVGAKLYEGTYAGNLGFDVRGETPLISMDERLTGVQVGPLLTDFMGKEYVTGEAQLTAKLTANGIDVMQIRSTLNGQGSFLFENGAVNGINLGQLLREGYAAYKGEPKPKEETRKTDFSELRGTFSVKDGLISNNDLSAKTPALRVTGQGTAHLATEKLNYRVNAGVVSSLEGQGGRELADLKGLTVPVQITGTFGDPKFGVAVGDVLGQRARQALESEKQKLQKQLEAEKKKSEEEAKKSLEQQLKEKLKDFKF